MLHLNKLKCAKVHVGKTNKKCNLNIENTKVKLFTNTAKGYGIVANIIALLLYIPLQHKGIETGLELKQAWLYSKTLKYRTKIYRKGLHGSCENL